MNKKTAVVILNWNGRALLEKFLPPLLKFTPSESAEIIVADNGSSDDSLNFMSENYPEIGQIRLDRNYGFAEGYNRALSGLDCEYAVLLNSDVEVTEGWLAAAVDYLDRHADVAALQPKILSYNDKTAFEYAGACGGFIDRYGHPFCRGRIFATIEKDCRQYDEPAEIVWASGACMFVRLKEYKDCGGLDATFFAHQEEIDMCWRLKARGRKIVCLPASVVYHVGGATLQMESPHKTFLNFRNNLLMIYKNLPAEFYREVFFYRFFADYLAALNFILKGHFANAQAIIKARSEFHKMKKDFAEARRKNLGLTVVNGLPKGFFDQSLLWNYYFRRRKKFSKLPFLRIVPNV
jgi:GT2 family glycosyltransferase